MRAHIRPSRPARVVLLSATLAAAVLSWTPAAAQEMVVFGDSLSDEGNFYAETGDSSAPPFEPIPSAPYNVGGHHFSNGGTWIGYLAVHLGAPTDAGPALRAPGVFTNYATGRARAREAAPQFPDFSLTKQVSLFLSDFGGSAPPEALYVVWAGPNDVRDALASLAADPTGATSTAIIQDALSAIGGNIFALSQAGARRFLVLNVPNVAITPFIRQLGAQDPLIPMAAEQLSVAFNDGLTAVLDGLEPITGARFLRLDTFGFLNAIAADPASVGLDNATDSCLAFGVVGNAFCDQPNRHLFWDGAHPTTAAHAALAREAANLLNGP